MLIKGERALAYIVNIDSITPIEGADHIDLAHVGGWTVVVKKEDFLPGERAVYFEIDSKLPETDERFGFLEKKHYCVQTMKLSKFGVYSQGLLMPLKDFPELGNPAVGTNVTKELKVIYRVPEDNERKATPAEKKHGRFCNSRIGRWLRKIPWIRNLFFIEKKKKRKWPEYILKTDEERIECCPGKLNNRIEYVCTEKLDGTSCSYGLEKKGWNQYDFSVCSRNIRLKNETPKNYKTHSIYWDMAFKYNIEKVLKKIMTDRKVKWVYIQGEGVGSVQGNPLRLKEDDLYLFNLVTPDKGRWPSEEAAEYMKQYGMKWVPIIGHILTPEDMQTFKEQADGYSVVNPDVLREGFVYRSLDGRDSFKNVSNKYLLKHGG